MSSISRRFVLITCSLISLAAVSTITYAGPKVTVGRRVDRQKQVSIDQIDHSDWDKLVATYVDERGKVDYRGWKESGQATKLLDRYLRTLSTANSAKTATQAAKLAYWINAYNAVTVKGILREYPTTSIRNHTARIVGYNIWKDLLLIAGDRKVNLEQIEHEILRKMGEPRIHFAIVCASTSCPRLLNEAYTAEKLEVQLVRNTEDFFANRSNFRYDRVARRVHLSAIMKWFATDFGKTRAAQLKTIAPYLPDEASRNAAANKKLSVSYLSYDWSINEQ